MVTREVDPSAGRTQMSSATNARSLVEDGDHNRVATGAERSGGSFTGEAGRRVCVERMPIVEDGPEVATHWPSGLMTHTGDAA